MPSILTKAAAATPEICFGPQGRLTAAEQAEVTAILAAAVGSCEPFSA
jgi:hypothetical protein